MQQHSYYVSWPRMLQQCSMSMCEHSSMPSGTACVTPSSSSGKLLLPPYGYAIFFIASLGASQSKGLARLAHLDHSNVLCGHYQGHLE